MFPIINTNTLFPGHYLICLSSFAFPFTVFCKTFLRIARPTYQKEIFCAFFISDLTIADYILNYPPLSKSIASSKVLCFYYLRMLNYLKFIFLLLLSRKHKHRFFNQFKWRHHSCYRKNHKQGYHKRLLAHSAGDRLCYNTSHC